MDGCGTETAADINASEPWRLLHVGFHAVFNERWPS